MKFLCLDCKKTFVYAATLATDDLKGVIERHVCPYCLGINIDEYVEAKPEIASVISIPIEEVDAKLKEGYIVRDLYAKTCTLVMLAKKEG